MTTDEIRQIVHKISLDVLKDIIDFCEKHQIEYFMMFGSLLGAVRHSGIIPWDDDIDIAMTRKNYLRFIECIKNDGRGFLLKNDIKTNGSGSTKYVSELKVGRRGTKYCATFAEDLDVNKYITVDIFCVDYLKPSYIKNIVRDDKLIRLLSVSKLNWSEKRYLIRTFKQSNGFIKYLRIIAIYLLHLLRLMFSEKGIEHFVYNMTVDTTNTSKTMGVVMQTSRPFYFSSNFTLKKVTFDNLIVFIPNNYDEILKTAYGDYMTPPPEDQRQGIDRFEVILEVDEKM